MRVDYRSMSHIVLALSDGEVQLLYIYTHRVVVAQEPQQHNLALTQCKILVRRQIYSEVPIT